MAGNTTTDSEGRLISSPRITALAPGEVFVFGSNGAGHHGGGAARIAHERFGAVWGEGHGLRGQSYAIDTMSGREPMLADIAAFLSFAAAHPELTFLVTEVGCGIAGYTVAERSPPPSAAPPRTSPCPARSSRSSADAEPRCRRLK